MEAQRPEDVGEPVKAKEISLQRLIDHLKEIYHRNISLLASQTVGEEGKVKEHLDDVREEINRNIRSIAAKGIVEETEPDEHLGDVRGSTMHAPYGTFRIQGSGVTVIICQMPTSK